MISSVTRQRTLIVASQPDRKLIAELPGQPWPLFLISREILRRGIFDHKACHCTCDEISKRMYYLKSVMPNWL